MSFKDADSFIAMASPVRKDGAGADIGFDRNNIKKMMQDSAS